MVGPGRLLRFGPARSMHQAVFRLLKERSRTEVSAEVWTCRSEDEEVECMKTMRTKPIANVLLANFIYNVVSGAVLVDKERNVFDLPDTPERREWCRSYGIKIKES